MKQQLTEKRKSVQEEIRRLKKFQRIAVKEKNDQEHERLDKLIETLERSLPRYKVTVQPIQFSNGVVVDGALIKAYCKKVPKGSPLTIAFTDFYGLTLMHKSGFISLQNVAHLYEGFELKKGEVFIDELGITISST